MAQKHFMFGDWLAAASAMLWRRRAARATDPAAFLRAAADRRRALDEAASIAEGRMAKIRAAEAAAPGGAEIWRHVPDCFSALAPATAFENPGSGVAFGAGLSIYHNASHGAAHGDAVGADGSLFALTQRPGDRGRGAYAIRFESYEFDGDYLSFVIAAPPDLRRPRAGEKLRLRADIAASRPMKVFLRLNAEGEGGDGHVQTEGEIAAAPVLHDFGPVLGGHEIGPKDALWAEILIDRPRMAEISLRAVSLSLIGAGAE